MGDKPAYSIVKGKKIPFIRAKSLRATLLVNVPEKEPSFADRVNEILSGSQKFREFRSNISDYGFNKSFVKVLYLRKPFVLVSFFFIKYSITSSSTKTKLY